MHDLDEVAKIGQLQYWKGMPITFLVIYKMILYNLKKIKDEIFKQTIM